MADRVTSLRYYLRAVESARPHRARRGSVLVLVMAILGILFVTGMTFLMTMSFEARVLRSERQASRDDAGVDQIEQMTGNQFRTDFIVRPGVIAGTGEIAEYVLNPITGLYETRTNPGAWAELPQVHGVLAQVEPYQDLDDPLEPLIFGYTTDLGLQTNRVFDAAALEQNKVRVREYTSLPSAIPGDFPALVDADGDGVVDARQFDLAALGYPQARIAELSKIVNGPTNPTGTVYLGLRIIPHGAMVDLDDAHPNLIEAVLDPDEDMIPVWNLAQRPYSPAIEEASLRWRNFLPPRVIASAGVQGNPANPLDNPRGRGDFGGHLFPPSGYAHPLFDSGESVWTGSHRYWPFSRSALVDEFEDWATRLNPLAGKFYDRRHLVTTTSHDDNLSRGATVARKTHRGNPADPDDPDIYEDRDVLELMIEASGGDYAFGGTCMSTGDLRFQTIAYPHTLPSGFDTESDSCDPGVSPCPDGDCSYGPCRGDPYVWCGCTDLNNGCKHDLRKGRLRLSLPWLDDVVAPTGGDRTAITPLFEQERNQLIQETFMLMLLNARDNGDVTHPDMDLGRFEVNVDNQVWEPDWRGIARTAASLTANMIDFMDADDEPTEIEVRYFEFGDQTDIADLSDPDLWKTKVGKSTCDLAMSGAYDNEGEPILCERVYGLERQPFITEIAAFLRDDPVTPPGGGLPAESTGYAVELFNPYEVWIPGSTFTLQITGAGSVTTHIVTTPIPARGYLVVFDDPDGVFTLTAPLVEDVTTTGGSLEFDNPSTIYLLRANPFGGSEIVVDQFAVNGANIGVFKQANTSYYSLERASVTRIDGLMTSPWFAPIPADPLDEVTDDHSLGADNDLAFPADDVRRVEVQFANTGSFQSAFPTTGSLLLLMRYANRPISDLGSFDRLAFTSHLRGIGITDVSKDIDNGRMPLFDEQGRHRVDPMDDPFDDDANDWFEYRPGETYHLPWGQFVFDYFTALPLWSTGPFHALAPGDTVVERARPRVDQDGLRVHGRINLNAAPWMVLSGLPFVPMDEVPQAFKTKFRKVLFNEDVPNNPPYYDTTAYSIDRELAKSIMAYREARGFWDGMSASYPTGNYNFHGDPFGTDPDVARGWAEPIVSMRRGTGFLTVGELANVRHPYAAGNVYRIDIGELAKAEEEASYLSAVAVLASLGDWTTVRSHVFTVYGTLRGAPDPSIVNLDDLSAQYQDCLDDINSRAIRFQETVDRLPMFLGERNVRRIGNRSVGRYLDVLNN